MALFIQMPWRESATLNYNPIHQSSFPFFFSGMLIEQTLVSPYLNVECTLKSRGSEHFSCTAHPVTCYGTIGEASNLLTFSLNGTYCIGQVTKKGNYISIQNID